MSDSEQKERPVTTDAAEHAEAMRKLQEEQREKVRAKEVDRGIVLVHTGDGKGKSTAAFGVAIRAAGCGQKVGLVQFIKGKWKTGEQAAIKRFPEVEHVVSGDGFTWDTQDREKDVASAMRGFEVVKRMLAGGEHDVVILDEVNVALSYGYLPEQELLRAIAARPEHVSVVLTGRGAPEALIEAADTVTEHVCVKHAFQAGIRARKGVEF